MSKSGLQVLIVNGKPGVGKSTFENFCQDILGEPFCQTRSTVDKVKEILTQLFSEDYEITADLIEAKSTAIIASIILEEVLEGTDL